MKLQYHIIDVFTDKRFGGNPTGVCLLPEWLPDETLQAIAGENNLSETAFLVKQEGYYDLRWFTPKLEINLCGHATMASAFVLLEDMEKAAHELKFKTMSGGFGVIVTAKGGDCDFVSRFFAPCAGIPEDPVTGRAHCSLIPFWSERLGKKVMTARQLSKRGGVIFCEDKGPRVRIGGKAVRYLRGEIEV